MKKIFNLTLICFLRLTLSAQVASEKPNIILIISDDLNDYIGSYQANQNVETPNIDLIAQNGTLFTNAHASCALCAPSRASFLTGKDLLYTQVYDNAAYFCSHFSINFSAEKGNEEYYTLPQHLKENAGYFTYSLNKVFHCAINNVEFDTTTESACEKMLAWNRYFVYEEEPILDAITATLQQGIGGYDFGRINDTLEPYMSDYIAVDSAISFIEQVAADSNMICDKPFFLALGLIKPHKNQFIPEKYFLEDYVEDFSADPFDIPYNFPKNADPANGIIMPPQPDIPFADIDSLPEGGIAQYLAGTKDPGFELWVENVLSPYPEIEPGLSEEERIEILAWSKKANAVMAYLAAVTRRARRRS